MHKYLWIRPGQVDCVYAHMQCQTLFTARVTEELGLKSIVCILLKRNHSYLCKWLP